MRMIGCYYIYLIRQKFLLETKNSYIFNALEDALSTKYLIFLFPLKFCYKEKIPQDTETKDGILLH